MNKHQEIYTRIVVFSLWALQLIAIMYILYCYFRGFFLTESQIIISVIVLIVTQVAILLKFDLHTALLASLITGHISILVTWGNIVPYIQFIPFILTYLMAVTKKHNLIAPYLWISLTLTIFEISKIIPLVSFSDLEIGTPNLILLIVLQCVTFIIWANLLGLYRLIEEIDILGLPELLSRKSKGFLVSTLTKGLYVSILFHFINNFLNSVVWGAEISESRIKVIKIISESDRSDLIHSYTLSDILDAADIRNTAEFSMENLTLVTSDSKTLFLLLHNIADNYRKYTSAFTYSIQLPVKNTLSFTFTSKKVISEEPKHFWSRNLGTMRQFLQLTKKGDLQIVAGSTFKTILTYKLSGLSYDSSSENDV